MFNSVLYSTVAGLGAAIFATAAGYAFAKFKFRRAKSDLWARAGRGVCPADGPRRADLPAAGAFGSQRQSAGRDPALDDLADRRLSDARLYRAGRRRRTARRSAYRWRRRVPDLPRHRAAAGGAGHGDRGAALVRRDLEQLLPAAHRAALAGVSADHGGPCDLVSARAAGRWRRTGAVLDRHHRRAGQHHPGHRGVPAAAAVLAGRPHRRRHQIDYRLEFSDYDDCLEIRAALCLAADRDRHFPRRYPALPGACR